MERIYKMSYIHVVSFTAQLNHATLCTYALFPVRQHFAI